MTPARAVHARRLAIARLGGKRDVVLKVYDELAPRFEDRPGGYTRVFKVGPRKGDNAPMVMIQLLQE